MTSVQWAALLGVVLPALVAFINRKTWKPQIKAAVAVLSSVLVGTANVLFNGGLGHVTMSNWATSVGIVFGASLATYHTIWKGSGAADWIESELNIVSGKQNVAPPAAPAA